MRDTRGNDLLVESLKLRQLVSSSKSGIATSSVLAVILACVQFEDISSRTIAIWLLTVLIIAILRFIWLINVQKKLPNLTSFQQCRELSTQFRAGIIFAAISWGLAGYFLYPEHSPQGIVFLMFMLAGLSAGGMASYSIDMFSASVYSGLVLLPVTVKLLVIGGHETYWMVFGVILFFFFIINSLRNIHDKSIDNILLRIDSNKKDSFIKEGEDRYHFLLEHLPIGVFHFDTNNIVTFCNKQVMEILQNSKLFDVGSSLDDLDDEKIRASLKSSIQNKQANRYEGVYGTDGKRWISVLYVPIKDAFEQVSGGIGLVQDITERKRSSKLIEQFALQDYLTELPNRRELINRLQKATDEYKGKGHDIALLYIDLDNFKTLNDVYGHAIGDLLLQKVSQRLRQSLRRKDLLAKAARIGGDEFIIVLEGLSKDAKVALKQAIVVADKVVSKLHQPFKLKQHQYECTVSVGIALYSDSKSSVDDLLRNADIAMYEAKKEQDTVRVYNEEMLALINTKESTKRALIKALKSDELVLYYQVQVNAAQKATGAEALIRWQRPKRGIVAPNEFIPLAEEMGLIIDIGYWVLKEACIQLSRWAKIASKKHLSISINVSPLQLLQKDFATEVEKIIRKHKVEPRLLKIEVTEGIFLDNTPEVINAMQALQKLGVGFELDDFGTGFSCLQYLKQLPLQQLKIDRSFVNEIESDKNDQSIVKTIMAMAEGFNINVIAEGVETVSQFELLKSYDCQHFQGYYFGQPMPINEFEAAITKNRKSKQPSSVKV